MAKNALASEELAKKFATEKETPYTRWIKAEGLDIIPALYVRNLRTVDAEALGAARRQRGVRQSRRLAHLQRQLRDGDSARQEARAAPAAVRGDDPDPRRPRLDHGVEQRGQAHHLRVEGGLAVRHPAQLPGTSTSTARARRPARYVGVTNAPPVINLYEDIDFIFNCDHDFKNRFNGEPDYFAAKNEQEGFLLQTNFVADAINLPLISAKERGAGGGHIRFTMAKGSMNSHISQFPIGTYKKGHAHGPGAYVIILSGEGYSLMWPEGEEPQRYHVGGRHADRAAQHVVPPALQLRHHAVALSRAQARGGVDPQRAGRAEGLDQPARRRRPDRLRRREAVRPQDVRRRARQARPRRRAWTRPTRRNSPTCRRSPRRGKRRIRSRCHAGAGHPIGAGFVVGAPSPSAGQRRAGNVAMRLPTHVTLAHPSGNRCRCRTPLPIRGER